VKVTCTGDQLHCFSVDGRTGNGLASKAQVRRTVDLQQMTDEELERLLADAESDRSERKQSLADPDKVRQAICVFANDLPNHDAPGVLFIGGGYAAGRQHRPVSFDQRPEAQPESL
jgi:hypothetical protein